MWNVKTVHLGDVVDDDEDKEDGERGECGWAMVVVAKSKARLLCDTVLIRRVNVLR